jgi:endonuclease/exonuclease/phosphatase family metal-dependent hydrolase
MAVVTPASEQVSGWDVAIAYDPAAFPGGVTHSQSHVFNNRFNTRDLLVARLSSGPGRELVVMATHWPSRKVSDAQPERYAAATYCDAVVEATLKYLKHDLLTPAGRPRLPGSADLLARWLTPVLIAGDFNDEPWDASVRALTSATPVRKSVTSAPTMPRGSTLRSVTAYLSRTPRLFNPTWGLDHNQPTPATYYYDSNWHRIDQMLVSAGMLTTGRPHFIDGSLRVHDVRTVTVAGNPVDVTTPSGYPIAFDPKTMRGVSDHLPLVANIEI